MLVNIAERRSTERQQAVVDGHAGIKVTSGFVAKRRNRLQCMRSCTTTEKLPRLGRDRERGAADGVAIGTVEVAALTSCPDSVRVLVRVSRPRDRRTNGQK